MARLHQWSWTNLTPASIFLMLQRAFYHAAAEFPSTPATRCWSTFFAEQRIGWQLELVAEKALPLVILTPLLNMSATSGVASTAAFSSFAWRSWSANCAWP
ncbi:fructosamine kinase family protein [Salmonella enterica subsp. enterica]|nr:fructosamine kinase family protein [Salmonella enterica subsp. enterica]